MDTMDTFTTAINSLTDVDTFTINVKAIVGTLEQETIRCRDNFDFQGYFDMVKNNELFYLSIFFIISKLLVRPLPENIRKTFLNPLLKLYNLAMVLFSAGTFIVMLAAIQEMDLYTNNCTAAFENEKFQLAAKFFYYSKFVEYFDSWSLGLAGKPVSFLQSFHHFGAPIDMFVFYHAKNEAIWIFVLLNSFVHTIMYAYYLATLFKIRFPLKSLITIMQITQFNLGFYLVWQYKNVECFYNSSEHMFGWLFNYFYVGTVLFLFMNFFLQTYILGGKKVEKKAKKE